MIVLTYQANMAKLKTIHEQEVAAGGQPLTEADAQQMAEECLNVTIEQLNKSREEQEAYAVAANQQNQLYESRSHVSISRFILESQR